MFLFLSTVSYGPGQYFDVDANSVANCPTGKYQDGLAQTSCKTCQDGYYPNSDNTECLRKLYSMNVHFFTLIVFSSDFSGAKLTFEIQQKIHFSTVDT